MGDDRQFNNIDVKAETKKRYEDSPLTLQIMHELKLSSQRWFIISIAELVVILVILFFIFVIPEETTHTVTQELESDNSSNITQMMED